MSSQPAAWWPRRWCCRCPSFRRRRRLLPPVPTRRPLCYPHRRQRVGMPMTSRVCRKRCSQVWQECARKHACVCVHGGVYIYEGLPGASVSKMKPLYSSSPTFSSPQRVSLCTILEGRLLARSASSQRNLAVDCVSSLPFLTSVAYSGRAAAKGLSPKLLHAYPKKSIDLRIQK